ncbi:UvrD-helicase domain-containing protein [Amphritea pacifica]|uniref:UvrD-helicase domain-containing protein n=1 Tax=Amphritea pacifica TaxID=2811233 RepID=UPI001963C2CE|nr:UvrD-helicase domain-containing protein [Amphritea pacifica]MBN1005681.1 AAA family ATPase [Amphritea pacifica]
MSDNMHLELAKFEGKGYVIAPAGYGKTHLIANAVEATTQRQLILTHTYAGVHSIQKKMQDLAVPSSRYRIDTIASWSLRMCLNYPITSNWDKEFPSGNEWKQLYVACTSLLNKPFMKRIVLSSYAGVYVDEYQDCSTQQHFLVEALANLLPCRLLGDPMQAIFDFADQPVDWEQYIYPHYHNLGELRIPWRWNLAGSKELGDWLDGVSMSLRAGGKIDLNAPLPKGVERIAVDLDDFANPKRLNFFYRFLKNEEAVIAIYSGDQKSKNKTHKLAQLLRGKFSSIEEVEGKDLLSIIKQLEKEPSPGKRLLCVIKLAKKCFNSVDKVLTAATKRGQRGNLTKTTRYPDVLEATNNYLNESTSSNLLRILDAINRKPETSAYRRDMLNRMLKILRLHAENPDLSLMESAQRFQRDLRHAGRPIRHNKLIGTTLLVKGLEYPHAIILDADAMSPKELYVALTRGAKSITIVSQKGVIPI